MTITQLYMYMYNIPQYDDGNNIENVNVLKDNFLSQSTVRGSTSTSICTVEPGN